MADSSGSGSSQISGLIRRVIPPGPDLWRDIEPAWTELLECTGEKSAFLSATWVGCWLESFGDRMKTSGLVWTDTGGKVVGCALTSLGSGRFGPFRVSRSFLNASGVPGVGCEHNDVLAVPEYRDRVLDDLVRVFRQINADEFALVGVREKLFEELASRWPRGNRNGFISESPYVSLSDIRAAGRPYLSELSSSTRAQIRRSIRRYQERLGAPSIRVASSAGQAAAWFSELVALHEERWRSKGQVGAFADADTRGFHEMLIERAAGMSGETELSVDLVRVCFGDQIIGILYSFVYRGNVHFYQSGLRYHDDARLKPGLVAHALTIEQCVERGDDEYDFLGGEPHPVRYKRSLSTDARTLAWIELQAPTMKMTALDGLRRLRQYLRRPMRTTLRSRS